MVLEIAPDFNCCSGLAEFMVFCEENLVQEHLWKYQSRIVLTVLPKIMLLYHPASV